MSHRSWNAEHGPKRGFYRDRENGWVFGVCAGIADRFDFNLAVVRGIAVLSLLLITWPTVALYLGATLLIREKPLIYSGRETEFEFWRRRHRDEWRHS